MGQVCAGRTRTSARQVCWRQVCVDPTRTSARQVLYENTEGFRRHAGDLAVLLWDLGGGVVVGGESL